MPCLASELADSRQLNTAVSSLVAVRQASAVFFLVFDARGLALVASTLKRLAELFGEGGVVIVLCQ